MDPHSQRLYHVCDLGQYQQTEERVRTARHAYYGMISYIDDKVGQLVRTLEATGQKDNTIIVFISDHGEMLGERGLWYKMSFFEWSARVPMLFYAPQRFAPRRVAHSVSLVDLLPTLVELSNDGGSPEYVDELDGSSLLPWLEGREITDPAPVYGEMLGEGAIAPLFMIRRGRFKYIFSQSDPEQLYDLDTDPHELTNLASQQIYEQVRAAFYEEMMTLWEPEELHQEVIASQHRRRFLDQSLRKGRFTPWDFQAHQDASQQYMRNHLDLNELEKTSRFPSPIVPPPDGLAG
jgi:choline-sulfatase